MEFVIHFLHWLASDQGLQAVFVRNWLLGLIIVSLVVYTEAVAFFLPFLPGDSLVITVGVYITSVGISPLAAIVIIGVAALLADITNYAVGRSHLGRYIIKKDWIKAKYMARLRRYFKKYGGATIVFAHFAPILRTAAPFLSGLTHMGVKKFTLHSVAGAFIWVASLVFLGMLVGQFEWVKRYIILWPIVLTAFGLIAFIAYAVKRRLQLGRWF